MEESGEMALLISTKDYWLRDLKPEHQVSGRHVCLCVSCKLTINDRIKYSVVLG